MDYEFYETPAPFTQWLFDEVRIEGICLEPAAGSDAIITATDTRRDGGHRCWVTNDLDPRWPTNYHHDAAESVLYRTVEQAVAPIDWTVTKPPFTPAIAIIKQALQFSRVGVAMHLRASIHEVLKTGIRRTFLAEHPPTGILWLPRFAYQRSKKRASGRPTVSARAGACGSATVPTSSSATRRNA
jgi:hypothetical protein